MYEVTGDPTLIALVALASLVPDLLVSVPARVLVDRFNRKHVVLGAEAVLGVAGLAIHFVGEGPWLVPVIGAVTILTSTMAAVFGPAQPALIPRLVAAEYLDAANSLNNPAPATARLVYIVGGSSLASAARSLPSTTTSRRSDSPPQCCSRSPPPRVSWRPGRLIRKRLRRRFSEKPSRAQIQPH